MTGAIERLFAWKVRGVRWVELIGFALVAVMILSVYVAKADAAREGARITALERDIAANQKRVRLLRAEAARLEQPQRLEALSKRLGLEPVEARREAGEESLQALRPAPAPVMPAPAEPEAAQ
jgi:hypothetical protein